jgi:hypothetical protein
VVRGGGERGTVMFNMTAFFCCTFVRILLFSDLIVAGRHLWPKRQVCSRKKVSVGSK